jgi:hypothetical protein
MLSGVWLLGIGFVLKEVRKGLGTVTTVLGMVTFIDGAFSIIGSVPGWLYAPVGVKLPLQIVWILWIGAVQLKNGSFAAGQLPKKGDTADALSRSLS